MSKRPILDLLEKVAVWKHLGKRLVFTNGCFDLLHPGHVLVLAEAKKHGDILIVGLNSDNSVRRLKGEDRPIMNQSARQQMLLSLNTVDEVIIFDEPTPEALIKLIIPDVLVKGNHYKIHNIVGADIVISHGGSVELVPIDSEYSTTSIIEKIKHSK